MWLLITILVFLYILIRAIYNPLSHDEIATYFHYIQSGEYLPPQKGIIWDANNHLLNSFLTEISYHIFGNSPLALRLPNVIAFCIYVSSIGLLIKHIRHTQTRILGFIACLTVGYLVEYFALSRGYALSMAFFVSSLNYLIKYIKNISNRHLSVVLLTLFLACLANLTLINTYGLIVLLVLCIYLLKVREHALKKSIGFFSLLFLSLCVMLYPIYYSFQLKASGALYYGSKEGLWKVTGETLTQQVFGNHSVLFGIFYGLILVSAIVLIFNKGFKRELVIGSPLFITTYLILGNLISIYFLVYFLDVNFPEDRAAFYFIPLFLFLLVLVIDRIPKLSLLRFGLLFFPIYFVTQINIQGSIFSADERVSETLHQTIIKDNLEFPTIGAYQTHILCYNYLEQRSNRLSNFAQPYKENDTLQDYLINKLALVDSSKIVPLYSLVYHQKETDVVLFKRKDRVQFNEVKTVGFPDTTYNWEYLNLIEDTLDNAKAIKINIQTILQSEKNYFKGNIVFSGRDSLNNEIEYQYINLDWLYGNSSREKVINQNFVVNTENIHHYVLYLWNIDQKTYSLNNSSIQLFYD